MSDIDEYRKMLEKENTFLNKALNSLPGLFFVLDSEYNYVMQNDKYQEYLNYSTSDLKNVNPLDFYYSEDHERIKEAMGKVLSGKDTSLKVRRKNKDGSYSWYHLTGTHLEENGKDYIIGTGIDITARVESQEKLNREREKLKKLFKNSPIGIVEVDKESRISDLNSSFETIFGYKKEQIIGKNIDELITPPKYRLSTLEVYEKQKKGSDSLQFESIRMDKNNNKVPVLIGNAPVTRNGHLIVNYIFYINITERKKFLEKLKKSLDDKNVLLQEIHHRVKNNLAVVMGLLQLKKFSSENERLWEILTECEMQIQAMAQIHEKLYESESLSSIQMDNYLQDFAAQLKRTYDIEDKVKVSTESDSFELNINQAIPCALIINEILSNAFEHAFKGREEGEINIDARKANRKIQIQIKDNGIGIPETTDDDSLGFKIIKKLTSQLGADLNIHNENGTLVSLSFNKKEVAGSSSLNNSYQEWSSPQRDG